MSLHITCQDERERDRGIDTIYLQNTYGCRCEQFVIASPRESYTDGLTSNE